MMKINVSSLYFSCHFTCWHKRAIQETCDLWDIWSEWWGNMTWLTFWQFLQMWIFLILFPWIFCWQFRQFLTIRTITKTILETCDIWDTDYISDNWKPESMTILVNWQLKVTLDSIRNSCNVLKLFWCHKSTNGSRYV